MRLLNLHSVLETCKEACSKVSLLETPPLPIRFKEAYGEKVEKNKSFSRNDRIVWGCNDVAEIWSRGNGTKFYLPSIAFYVAKELVPFYKELISYRSAIENILVAHGKSLKDLDESGYVPYIQASTVYTAQEKEYLIKFATDGKWWGKGRQIHRSQDFFESPLMQCAGLTQENQSEIARIAKQLSEDSGLMELLGSKIDLRKEFECWLTNVHKKSDGAPLGATAIGSYIRALDVSTKQNPDGSPASNHGKVVWHNIYQHLHGNPAPKGVFQIDNLAEFDTMFGPLKLAVNKGDAPPNVVSQHFTEIQQWIAGQTGGAFLPPALDLYGKFLQWREGQQKEMKSPELPPANIDRLTVALKMFAEKRTVDKPSGWDSYDAWTKGVRDEFSQVGESLLTKPGFDYVVYLRKYSISWPVVNTKFAPHTSAEKHAVLKFLREQKESPKSVSWYIDDANRLEVGGNRVDGMSAKTLLYFMSELRPAEFAPWTEPTYEGLAFLGLHKGPAPKELTVETYEDCKAKQHQIVARMKELGIGKASDDATDPDYRTVNEFLWWLGQNDNKDLIKEKIMAKEFKNVSKKAKTGERKLSKAVENDEMMQRLMAALRTKPFAILAGHSGTGKSQLVRRLAYMTCNDEGLLAERNDYNAPGNYCMVQVKPNWHDSTDLLGYYTEMNGGKYHTTSFVEFICKAYAYPETPFFVCLDEMNLAPVEQYFAEFLSAIESYSETTKCTDRLITEKASPEEICGETKLTESLEEVKKHGLTIPRNLFVVGTVNVDETTCQFSRKVLDRAMTILMTAVSFKSMTEPNDPSKEECLDLDGIRFFLERPTQTALVPEQMDRLDEVQKQIGDTPFAIAYRFANEYALYQAAYQILMDKGVGSDGKPDLNDAESQKTALDHVVLMKLLPRIHGEKVAVKNIFCGYDRKKEGGATEHIDGLKSKLPSNGLSVAMMDKILARPDEYLTFWP